MAIELTPTAGVAETYHAPFSALRWSGIFAGLVVGIATNLFLMLLGAAAGLAVFSTAETATDSAAVAAAIWNTLCMIVSAFAGGYVAARAAGMRRLGDGVLHGVVAWGVTMLISTLLVTSFAGATIGSLFGASTKAERNAVASVAGTLDEGNRQDAIGTLRDRLGISSEQASKLVDQALILSGRPEAASEAGREAARDNMRTASVASGWLSGAIVLSLFSAMGGGLLGARGARREVRRPAVATVRTPVA